MLIESALLVLLHSHSRNLAARGAARAQVPCQQAARSSTKSADPERADPEQHMLLSEGSSSRKHEHRDIVTPKTAEVAT